MGDGYQRAMSNASTNRLRERRILLIIWSITALVVTIMGIGFAGGVRQAFTNSLWPWLVIASPLIPLILWLRALVTERVG